MHVAACPVAQAHLRSQPRRILQSQDEGEEAMNDQEFIDALESCTLPACEFAHAAHVRAAYLFLRAGSFGQAIERTSNAIRRYATSLQVPGKYHETMTVA